MKLKREFSVVWLAFGALLAVTEFILPPGYRDLFRIIAWGVFVPTEGWAVGRPGPGDSLTEHILAFYGGKPARVPLVVSMAFYLPTSLVNIAVDPDLMVGRIPLTVLMLGIGLIGWLVPHFLWKGEKG